MRKANFGQSHVCETLKETEGKKSPRFINIIKSGEKREAERMTKNEYRHCGSAAVFRSLNRLSTLQSKPSKTTTFVFLGADEGTDSSR